MASTVARAAGPFCPDRKAYTVEEVLIAIMVEAIGVAFVALIALAVRRLWPAVQAAPAPVLRLVPAAAQGL